MTKTIVMILCLASLPWVAVAGGASAPGFGILTVNPDSTICLSTRADGLERGDSVLAVLETTSIVDTSIFVRGQVERSLAGPCQKLRGVLGDSVRTYSVHLDESVALPLGPLIAVIGSGLVTSASSDTSEVRVPGEREPYTFRVCASAEGLHFTAWQGRRRVWHEYYYLGYDVEPNCSDEEVGP